jgi:cardiolipin synthase
MRSSQQRFCALLVVLALTTPAMGAAAFGVEPPPPAASYLPLVVAAQQSSRADVLISAIYYDTYLTNEPDEAIQLWNLGASPRSLQGWRLSDGSRTTTLPDLQLAPGGFLWCAREARAFASQFGHAPACEWGADSDPTVPNATGSALRLANQGGIVSLHRPDGSLADVVVYGEAATSVGWQGPAVTPYTASGFGREGQVLYRKLDATARPLPDSDRALDWASDATDRLGGQRVRYPGWDLEEFWPAYAVTETATLTVAVAPDNALDVVLRQIWNAQESIAVEAYTLESAPIALALAAQAQAGVAVTILLEGTPGGGIRDQQRWATQRIVEAGGRVYYLVNDRNGAHDRYRYQHAKLMVFDGRVALVSSENFTEEAMPSDDKSNGTAGRRGALLLTDAPGVVARLQALLAVDLDPAHHADVFAWEAGDPSYGAPPPGYAPPPPIDQTLYPWRFAAPLVARDRFAFEVVQSPETSLRADAGLLPLVARAGAGDTVLVQQLYEQLYWGDATGAPEANLNPRLEAYLAAARRGAQVRLILDSLFADPLDARGNHATAAYVNQVARAEGLDLSARLGNPTYLGVHNKMVLVRAGGRGWVHVGSLNGSEGSAKVNRELALQVQSDAAYSYLAAVFESDWQAIGGSR